MFDALKFDHMGNRIYPGKTVRALDWSVTTDTALPSWLTFTNSDASNLALSVVPIGTYGSDGYVQLQWSNTPSTSANSNIKLNLPIDLRQFHEVGFVFKDLLIGNSLGGLNQLDLTIATHIFPTCGVWFKQNSSTQVLESRVYMTPNADNFSGLPYAILGNAFGAGRKNLGMALSIPEKRAYLLSGEDVPVAMVEPTHPNGANSSWPVPPNLAGSPYMTMELRNVLGAADANAFVRFSGFKAWFVTG